MSAPPTHLTGLSVREAIADSIHRALAGFDRHDEELVRSSLTEDIALRVGPRSINGMVQITEQFFPMFEKLETTHCASNIRIEVADGAKNARAWANGLVMHLPRDAGADPGFKHYSVGGLWDLHIVLEDGGLWKIKTWNIKRVWGQGDPSVVAAH